MTNQRCPLCHTILQHFDFKDHPGAEHQIVIPGYRCPNYRACAYFSLSYEGYSQDQYDREFWYVGPYTCVKEFCNQKLGLGRWRIGYDLYYHFSNELDATQIWIPLNVIAEGQENSFYSWSEQRLNTFRTFS